MKFVLTNALKSRNKEYNMDCINKLYTYTNFEKFKYGFQFQIIENENCVLEISIINKNNKTIETVSSINLVKKNNNVYNSDNIFFKTEMYYENYKILSSKVLLKFKNETLSPVSTLFITCIHNESEKKRLFAFTLEDMGIENTCIE